MAADPIHVSILKALHRVPEVHLAVYDLARELTGPDGQVDVERAVFPSKRQLRKARRAGERFPSVVEVCKAAVLDWKAKH